MRACWAKWKTKKMINCKNSLTLTPKAIQTGLNYPCGRKSRISSIRRSRMKSCILSRATTSSKPLTRSTNSKTIEISTIKSQTRELCHRFMIRKRRNLRWFRIWRRSRRRGMFRSKKKKCKKSLVFWLHCTSKKNISTIWISIWKKITIKTASLTWF